MFDDTGLDIEVVDSGYAALNRIRNRGMPALVVTDIRMAEMDGVELARRLRAESPSLKIFAMTGLSLADVHEDVFDRVIVKPAEPGELIALVRRVLDGAGR